MKRFTASLSILIAIGCIVFATPAHAILGVGDVVFDPTMYASQLQELAQETATVQNLAQQLQYVIKNTTGGGAGGANTNQTIAMRIERSAVNRFISPPRDGRHWRKLEIRKEFASVVCTASRDNLPTLPGRGAGATRSASRRRALR